LKDYLEKNVDNRPV